MNSNRKSTEDELFRAAAETLDLVELAAALDIVANGGTKAAARTFILDRAQLGKVN